MYFFTKPSLLFVKPCTDPPLPLRAIKQKYSTEDRPFQSKNFLTPYHLTSKFFGGGGLVKLVGDMQNDSGENKIITPVRVL